MLSQQEILKLDVAINCSAYKEGYKIPNIVHYTFCSARTLPTDITDIIIRNKQICSKCNFIFYDDNECDNLIKLYFTDVVYNAYCSINPAYGAMKADFFRYCVLYAIGGIYIDIKSVINYPIFKLLTVDDTCLLDKPRPNLEPWRKQCPAYEQWLLIFAPKHPYLLEMINYMVYNISRRYEPKIVRGIKLNTKGKILHITGPDAFTHVIHKYLSKSSLMLHRSIDYNRYFAINNGTPSYLHMYALNNKTHYSQLNEPLYI